MGFLKIRRTFLGGIPIIRNIEYWNLYWGTLILAKYHKNSQHNKWQLLFVKLGHVLQPYILTRS